VVVIVGIGEDGVVTTTEAQAAPNPPAPNPNSAAARLARTPGDMAKAVLVLLVPVAVLVALYVYFFGGANVISIDPSGTFSDARAAAAFTVLEPSGLPKGWDAVSSSYENGSPATLRVGYVSPSGAGIQLVESNGNADAVIRDELGKTGDIGTSVPINGTDWGFVNGDGDKALIDTTGGRTVIVLGEATRAELTQFATALR
jgi:hypothetical protein